MVTLTKKEERKIERDFKKAGARKCCSDAYFNGFNCGQRLVKEEWNLYMASYEHNIIMWALAISAVVFMCGLGVGLAF